MFSPFKMAETECTVKNIKDLFMFTKGSLDYELRFQFKCKDHPPFKFNGKRQ